MSASREALIRAVDALKELEEPQGATQEGLVAPAKCLEKHGRSHTDHRGHSETADHAPNYTHAPCNVHAREHAECAAPLRVYSSRVAPVAHVAPGIDSEGKNRGHTARSCGPLWHPPEVTATLAPPGVPAAWIQGLARLRTVPPPHDYPAPAWQQLVIDVARFLDLWGAQAAMLGWPAWELFGCHRRAPWGRIQGMGMVLLLRGKELAALTESEAAIRTATGAHQTYRRKPADPLHPAERCLVWELHDG